MFEVPGHQPKIDLLAKAGLWYDSLGEALTAKDVGLRKAVPAKTWQNWKNHRQHS